MGVGAASLWMFIIRVGLGCLLQNAAKTTTRAPRGSEWAPIGGPLGGPLCSHVSQTDLPAAEKDVSDEHVF